MKLGRRLAYLGLAFIVFLAANIQAPAAALTKEELQEQNREISQKLSSLNAQLRDIETQANALSAQANTLESQIALLQAEQARICSASAFLTSACFLRVLFSSMIATTASAILLRRISLSR